MLPKLLRLPLKKDTPFRGSSISAKFFRLIFQKNSQTNSRLGIIISKKVDKSAVKRNHLKRQLANAFKGYLTSPPHNDYLIIPQKSALEAGYAKLKLDIAHILKIINAKNA